MRLSIRWRLTLWNTLALAVVLSCFAALVYGLFSRALLEQTDQLLQSGLVQLRNDPRAGAAPDERMRYWIEEYREHLNLLCVVYDADGRVHIKSDELGGQGLPPPPAEALDRRGTTERLPGLGRRRVMAERMRLGGREYVVLILAPLQAVDRELAQIRVVLLFAGVVVLLLSAVLAYWLARQALAPMDRLRRTTDAITADRLDRRLPVLNPHDELGLLAQTVNAMVARLEGSFAEIRRFTADASHELRTPLTALRSQIEVALGKSLKPADCQRLLEDLLEELLRLSRLTDELLTLSRRDAGVEHLTPAVVELTALAAEVAEAMRPLAEARGVRLAVRHEAAAEVAGDAGRLRQVLINLLDNALKHTAEGGEVVVRVEARGPACVVTVRDTGTGIPAEHLPRVFDRFYRVDKARSRAEGGTGLGLSIAQSIVKAHGGSIEIASTLGEGTVCTVRLPAWDRTRSEAETAGQRPTSK